MKLAWFRINELMNCYKLTFYQSYFAFSGGSWSILTGSLLRECDGIRHAPQPAMIGRHFTSVPLSNHTDIVRTGLITEKSKTMKTML